MAVVGQLSDGLQLWRREYYSIGTCTSTSNLAIYPPGKKKQNKIVASDDSGLVVSFDVRKGVVTPAFRASVGDGRVLATAVQSVRDVSKTPNVFISAGKFVRGLSKVGKEFFSLASPLADPITCMRVCDTRLWVSAGFTYNEFTSGRDSACVLCPDRILCMEVPPFDTAAVLASTVDVPVHVLLGCGDRFIRVVKGSAIVASIGVEGPVSALAAVDSRPPGAAGVGVPPVWQLFYGTSNGYVGLIMVSGTTLQHAWAFTSHTTLANAHSSSSSGGAMGGGGTAPSVNGIAVADLTGRKGWDIVVARDDGAIEVYASELVSVPSVSGASGMPCPPPPRVFQLLTLDESVRAVQVGCVSTPGYAEIIVCTLAGRIISFTTEPLGMKDAEDAHGRSKAVVLKDAALTATRKRVDDLKKAIATASATLSTRMARGGAAAAAAAAVVSGSTDAAMAMARLEPITHWQLEPSDAAYTLTLEIPAPIESVMLVCTAPVDLLDAADTSGEYSAIHPSGAAAVADSLADTCTGRFAALDALTGSPGALSTTASNASAPSSTVHNSSSSNPTTATPAHMRATAAILSRSPVDPEARAAGVFLLATARAQEHTSRIILRMRTVEGTRGEVQAHIVNKTPPKSSVSISLPVRPLSLHTRLLTPCAEVEAKLEGEWASHTAAVAAQVAAATTPDGSGAPASGPTPATPPSTFPFTTLSITGTFTLTQMHEWVASCIPDVPSRMTAESPVEIALAFKNVFLGSHLLAAYRKGSAQFKSDSPTAIAILKESISNAATALKIRLTTSVTVPPYALRRVLSLLHTRLTFALTLAAKVALIDAVRELADTEAGDDKSFLSPDHVSILANADALMRAHASRARMTEYMTVIITDAFVDVHKFKGRDVISNVRELHSLLASTYPRAPVEVLDYLDAPPAAS